MGRFSVVPREEHQGVTFPGGGIRDTVTSQCLQGFYEFLSVTCHGQTRDISLQTEIQGVTTVGFAAPRAPDCAACFIPLLPWAGAFRPKRGVPAGSADAMPRLHSPATRSIVIFLSQCIAGVE